jgi:hypothetical protein
MRRFGGPDKGFAKQTQGGQTVGTVSRGKEPQATDLGERPLDDRKARSAYRPVMRSWTFFISCFSFF